MIKRILLALVCLAMVAGMLAGCSAKESSSTQQDNETSASTSEELLAKVINAVYADIENSSLSDATDEILKEQFFLNPEDVQEYAIRTSDFKYGVADVYIVKPVEGKKQVVLDAFASRQQSRMAECENYDIHNSYAISKNAQVYERGGYVIMLMLSDNEAAKKIIDQHLV